MAQWANTLDITDAWAKAYDREIAPPEFCRLVANKLKDMAFKAKYAYMADRRDELADAFMYFYEEYKDDPEAAEYDVFPTPVGVFPKLSTAVLQSSSLPHTRGLATLHDVRWKR